MKDQESFEKQIQEKREQVALTCSMEVIRERLVNLLESPATLLEFQQTCLALGMACSAAQDDKRREATMHVTDAAIMFSLIGKPLVADLDREIKESQ